MFGMMGWQYPAGLLPLSVPLPAPLPHFFAATNFPMEPVEAIVLTETDIPMMTDVAEAVVIESEPFVARRPRGRPPRHLQQQQQQQPATQDVNEDEDEEEDDDDDDEDDEDEEVTMKMIRRKGPYRPRSILARTPTEVRPYIHQEDRVPFIRVGRSRSEYKRAPRGKPKYFFSSTHALAFVAELREKLRLEKLKYAPEKLGEKMTLGVAFDQLENACRVLVHYANAALAAQQQHFRLPGQANWPRDVANLTKSHKSIVEALTWLRFADKCSTNSRLRTAAEINIIDKADLELLCSVLNVAKRLRSHLK